MFLKDSFFFFLPNISSFQFSYMMFLLFSNIARYHQMSIMMVLLPFTISSSRLASSVESYYYHPIVSTLLFQFHRDCVFPLSHLRCFDFTIIYDLISSSILCALNHLSNYARIYLIKTGLFRYRWRR